jgi:hypothetical protein
VVAQRHLDHEPLGQDQAGHVQGRPPGGLPAAGRKLTDGGRQVEGDDDRGRGHDRPDEQPGDAWERGPDALGERRGLAHHVTAIGRLGPGGRRPVAGPGPGGRLPAGPGPRRGAGSRDTDSTRVHGDSSPLRVRPGGGGLRVAAMGESTA